MKNRENVWVVIGLVALTIAGVIGCFFCPKYSPIIFAIGMLIALSILLACNLYRYGKIRKLNTLLTQMQSQQSSVLWEEYQEGELGILYSQLVKVMNLLVEQREALVNDKNYLQDALSDISHQLKTPLTSMMVMAELLGQDDLPNEKRKEFTRKIMKQLERMEWLISVLLKMSKLDAGTVKIEPKKIDAGKLLDRAVAHLMIPMEIREVSYEQEGEEVSLVVDPQWMAEAIANIVKNCMEHTEPGGSIHVVAKDNPLYTSIDIRDTGCGIEKSDLPHIFKRFYRGENADPDSVGIGLAFAKQIVTLHNGAITVKSTIGKGTEFRLKIYKRKSD